MDEFRKDAVRIILTSGLTRKQVTDNLRRFQKSISVLIDGRLHNALTFSKKTGISDIAQQPLDSV